MMDDTESLRMHWATGSSTVMFTALVRYAVVFTTFNLFKHPLMLARAVGRDLDPHRLVVGQRVPDCVVRDGDVAGSSGTVDSETGVA